MKFILCLLMLFLTVNVRAEDKKAPFLYDDHGKRFNFPYKYYITDV